MLCYRFFGCKWTICLSLTTYIPYFISQFYVRAYTIIPSAVICGIGSGPLWIASSTYLIIVTKTYSTLFNKASNAVIWKLSVIFYSIIQCSHMIGNLISSLGIFTIFISYISKIKCTEFYILQRRNSCLICNLNNGVDWITVIQ